MVGARLADQQRPGDAVGIEPDVELLVDRATDPRSVVEGVASFDRPDPGDRGALAGRDHLVLPVVLSPLEPELEAGG